MTEDYVSVQTAELLKEKGMDKSCFKHYVQKNNNNGTSEAVTVCTHQIAMKWLREVHKTFISITYENDGVFTANLKVPLKGIDCMIDNKHNCWFTYEEACEIAIKYCLEYLI